MGKHSKPEPKMLEIQVDVTFTVWLPDLYTPKNAVLEAIDLVDQECGRVRFEHEIVEAGIR